MWKVSKDSFHLIELSEEFFHVKQKYTDFEFIGQGSFGYVCSATDNIKNCRVAVKKVLNPFDSEKHAKCLFREIHLLRNLFHKNIIQLYDVFTSNISLDDFNDIYIVSPLMSSDLAKLIKSETVISDDSLIYITFQLLSAINYMGELHVIHRDLKPSNIAVNDNFDIKIMDFGQARKYDLIMSGYVTTRWYRAPEVMFSWERYNPAVDMWSLGCIVAELMTRETLLQGECHLMQLQRIIELVGTPNEEFFDKISLRSAVDYMKTIKTCQRVNFRNKFQGNNIQLIDFLDKILLMDPDKRISSKNAINLPLFAAYEKDKENTMDEITFCEQILMGNFPLNEWKRNIWNECNSFDELQ